MYKDILRSIEHIEIWPVVSFVIFFLFFLIMIWWVMTVDKKFINTMSNMPLDDQLENQTHTNPSKP
ncbi:MAG: cbb3-type cytochrome c oxidase subunit 3 [Cyclobacteriaceae bacterium]